VSANLNIYLTGFHIGAVSVNWHKSVWIFIVQVVKFTNTCTQVFRVFYLYSLVKNEVGRTSHCITTNNSKHNNAIYLQNL